MLVPSEAFSVRIEPTNGAAHVRLTTFGLQDVAGWHACLACGRYAHAASLIASWDPM